MVGRPTQGSSCCPLWGILPCPSPPSPSLLANVIGFTLVDQRKPCSLYSFGGIQNYTLKQLPKKSPSFQMLYWTIYFSFFTFDVLSFRSWFRPEQWSSNWFYCLHTFDPPSKSYNVSDDKRPHVSRDPVSLIHWHRVVLAILTLAFSTFLQRKMLNFFLSCRIFFLKIISRKTLLRPGNTARDVFCRCKYYQLYLWNIESMIENGVHILNKHICNNYLYVSLHFWWMKAFVYDLSHKAGWEETRCGMQRLVPENVCTY